MPRTTHRSTVSHPFFISAFALAVALPATAGTHLVKHLPVPEHSFLSYHAANVRELSQEVTLEPTVRARLAKHFHLSEAKLTAYIRQNLVLTPLKHAGTYQIACVRPNGEEFWVKSYLPAGTPVFASRATGRPILKLACGNPMVVSLPAPLLHDRPFADPQLATAPALSALLPATAPTLMAAAVPDSALLTTSDLIQPPVVQVSPSLQFLGGSAGSSFLPALLGLGGAIAVFGRGGSDGGSQAVVTPVPETSSFVSMGMLLALGCGIIIVSRRKRQAAAENFCEDSRA